MKSKYLGTLNTKYLVFAIPLDEPAEGGWDDLDSEHEYLGEAIDRARELTKHGSEYGLAQVISLESLKQVHYEVQR